MLNLLKALRQDENGVILSTELVVIGSMLVIGLITGLTCLQKSLNGELQDVANAIGSLDQSYSFPGFRKGGYGGQCCAYTAGSSFNNCQLNVADSGCDIVGCHAIGVPLHEGNCGECGGAVGGCSDCGSGYPGVLNGPRRIDPDVPNMKITEWPSSSDYPVGAEIPIQGSDVIVEPFIVPQDGWKSFPSPEPLPLPIPEIQAVPEAPVQAPTGAHSFDGVFNFPSRVW